MDSFFKLSENKTNVRTEIIAGITTFVTMAYILAVNPHMLGGHNVAIVNGVYVATCLSAFVGTILMGLLARLPFAQASGMGLNAFFAFTVMGAFGYSYNEALAIVFISGLLFLLITAFGLREAIVKAIPQNIKIAMSAGIGLFIAFVGLKGAGVVVNSEATFVELVNFTNLYNSDPEIKKATIGAVIAIVGLIIIAVLYAFKVKGSILIGIVASTLIAACFGLVDPIDTGFFTKIGQMFTDFANNSFLAMDFAGLFEGSKNIFASIASIFLIVISFSLVDMFDTIGTLVGTARKAGMVDENGDPIRMKQALFCDAIATTTGAMLGTSTVTTYVESSAGVAEGGRTGITAVTTAVLFLVALVAGPVVLMVPGCATAPALIFVGVLMVSGIKDIDFDDITEAVPAFLTFALMPLTYSIATGIAFGLISYVLIKLLSGKVKDIHPVCAVLAILFLIKFFIPLI